MPKGGVWPGLQPPPAVKGLETQGSYCEHLTGHSKLEGTFYIITMEMNIFYVAKREMRSHTCLRSDKGELPGPQPSHLFLSEPSVCRTVGAPLGYTSFEVHH